MKILSSVTSKNSASQKQRLTALFLMTYFCKNLFHLLNGTKMKTEIKMLKSIKNNQDFLKT